MVLYVILSVFFEFVLSGLQVILNHITLLFNIILTTITITIIIIIIITIVIMIVVVIITEMKSVKLAR